MSIQNFSSKIDQYLTLVGNMLDNKFPDYDKFAVISDLKQYIFEEAEKLSTQESIPMQDSVEKIIIELGSPEEFTEHFILELQQQRKELKRKALFAIFIAIFPFLLIVLAYLWQ